MVGRDHERAIGEHIGGLWQHTALDQRPHSVVHRSKCRADVFDVLGRIRGKLGGRCG